MEIARHKRVDAEQVGVHGLQRRDVLGKATDQMRMLLGCICHELGELLVGLAHVSVAAAREARVVSDAGHCQRGGRCMRERARARLGLKLREADDVASRHAVGGEGRERV